MGNNESSNKEALAKARLYQIYTNEHLPIDARIHSSSSPWQVYNDTQKEQARLKNIPEKEISGIKNEVSPNGSLNSEGSNQSQQYLTFLFDSLNSGVTINFYLGSHEKMNQEGQKIYAEYIPLKGTAFERMLPISTKFPAGVNQVFQPYQVIIDLDNYLIEGNDFTKASLSYYPLVIQMVMIVGQLLVDIREK
ncbi:UNKNOWN [Stylonychia lemnae]|uniref:Uncharacterized protein n=1 Tax=Stylonychia lemnae TaxID=5949 RepID=A0A078AKD5_STYLE|nr:UNKNOWN [Stylonychia lemnae]|eukprot:CDW82669.1 UNKNOWN [Stylonychia lemnae]